MHLPHAKVTPVHGGDINEAYCIFSKEKKYFLKLNNASAYPKMFEKETDGLHNLKKYFSGKVPDVIDSGAYENKQYLLLEWVEQISPQKDFWKNFGNALALMHNKPQQFFGWHTDNYIGSLQQINIPKTDWQSFYAEMRIMPMIKTLYNNSVISVADVKSTEHLCKELINIFPQEPPSFLHGDLWSGNFMVAANGYASVYDPAVYCGHREMDIGMTKLFGGFDQVFYDAYNETYPLQKNWKSRLNYTQLFPLLVHAILFGGHYINSVKTIIGKF